MIMRVCIIIALYLHINDLSSYNILRVSNFMTLNLGYNSMSHRMDLLPPDTAHPSAYTVSFFHIETAHNAWLAVKNRNGQLYNARDPFAPGFLPLVAMRISSRPGVIFLTTDAPEQQPQLWLEHYTTRGTVLSVIAKKNGDSGQLIALEDPQRPGKYFTTRPLQHDKTENPVVGDCHHIMRWEEFSLSPVEGSEHLQHHAQNIATLCRHNLTAPELIQFIQSYQGKNLLPTLDSLLPIIKWDVLEKIGEYLLHDTALQQKLGAIVPSNLWLQKGFPQLTQWERQRRAHTSRAISPFLPAQRIDSPKDESFLAWSGQDGSFAGFLHALIHAARRTIQPQRRVCMLATMRNEGLYLLEWIAYHRTIGIEHFFIYSNNNTDKSDLLLEELADQGIITWINNTTSGEVSAQMKAYGHAMNILPDILDFRWCFTIDGDEFITLDPQTYPSVIDYLDWIDHWQTDAVAINWRFLASEKNPNGLADLAHPLTARNNKIVGNGAIGDGWRFVKSMNRPNRTLHSRPHHPTWNLTTSYTFRLSNGSIHEYQNSPASFWRDPAFADHCYFDRIVISHYYFKSAIEWTWKHARNSGDAIAKDTLSTDKYNNKWANTFGLQAEDPKHERNTWMIARRDDLTKELKQLRQNPTIRAAENTVRSTLNDQLHDLWAQIYAQDIFKNIDPQWHFLWDDLKLEMHDRIPPISETTKL